MLILGLELDDEVIIDSGNGLITVKLTRVEEGYVKLGFDAPKSIPIHRKKVYESIQRGEKRGDQ